MRNYFISLLTCLLFCSSPLIAQKDVKAKQILDMASEKHSNMKGISAGFTLNIKDKKVNVTESFDGKMLTQANRFFLSIPDADTWFDGKTQWVWLKGPDEVNITEPNNKEASIMNPSFLFTIYKNGFNYKYRGEKTDIKKRPVYEIELIPQKKTDDIAKIIIQIHKTDYMPVTFFVFYKENLENIVYINNYTTGSSYPDTIFVFDETKHPGAEIIDLR